MEICFVEDCRLQTLKLEKALKELAVEHETKIYDNATEVLFLMQEGTLTPDLLVVDLNMPQMTGLELIREVKESIEFCHIPIVVLTSSTFHRDIADCYQYSVSGYFNKASAFNVYLKTLKKMIAYWEMNVFLTTENQFKYNDSQRM
jgi:DNA-binding NarL/FixJ family response regulator